MTVLTDIFTKRGLKFLGVVFASGFLLGGIVCIVGFCMVVDLMAGR